MSPSIAAIVGGVIVFASLPYWLPPWVVRLRMHIFTRINGEEALQLPNEQLGPEEFRRLYAHPAMSGRSAGAALSDLFWYWLAPGPEMHQEHLENGPRYKRIARFSREVLALPRARIDALVDACFDRTATLQPDRAGGLVRLRDVMMPFWASFYYEVVFGERCPDQARALIVGHADDVVTALKCCSLRHMARRRRLTKFLLAKLEAGGLPLAFPEGFSLQEQAYYLQGTFFNTAIVQMSEAMSHLVMVLAQHPDIQEKMAAAPDDRDLYDHAVDEALRLYPLFGIAHRITAEPIEANGSVIDKGSVVCFNYPAYHQQGYERPEQYEPDRWERCPVKGANFMPFGVPGNRPCPAQGIALVSMKRLAQRLLLDYRFATSAEHTRSMPNRCPCLMVARRRATATRRRERLLLLWLRQRDRWESVYRSLAQLVFGVVMILDARRLRLCGNYFGTHRPGQPDIPAG